MRNINDYSEKYMEQNFEDYQVEYRRRNVLEVIKKVKPNRILEIGCGMEPLFKYIDYKYNLHFIVEPSKLFCENAKIQSKGMSFCNEIRVVNDFFHCSKELRKIKFNMILCTSLLHELEDPGVMLDDIRALCEKDTFVYVNVPNAYSIHRQLAKAMGIIKDTKELSERNIILQQSRVYNMHDIQELMKHHGFEVIGSGTLFVKPFTHGQMWEMMLNNIIDKEVLDGLYELGKLKEFEGIGSEIYITAKLKRL